MPLLIIGALFVVWIVMQLGARAAEARNEELYAHTTPSDDESEGSIGRSILTSYLATFEPDKNGERPCDLDRFFAEHGPPPEDDEDVHGYLDALIAHVDEQFRSQGTA
jgi:hypothetical protein